ncbi:MAG: ShlB/FhaC/HecB family hemolysin secretion/activation protein, partial [Burkholderiales bacterium]|nr:ShlB/FhaC/HecB family hemolysin secretion/activation protein [Burkholderiales bacterium]
MPRSDELAPLEVVPPSSARAPEVPAPPRELGKPEGEFHIDVTRYEVDPQAPPELRAALARITAPYVGRNRSFEDLSDAAAEVTRFLQRDLGLYLGYAYLPEQAPTGGVIRIAVLEGRLDRVVLKWSEGLPVRKEVVEAYLARLVPGSVLKVRDVERVVFLVNDLRGITARFEIEAGAKPGTALLVVTPRAESRWTGKAEADVNGSRFLGPYRLGALVQRNSPFGRGDGLTATVLTSTTGGLAFALLGYTTPVGGDGFKLGASLSAVKYQLNKSEFPLDLNGSAVTANAFALYPLVRSRNLNLFTLASFEHKAYDDRQQAVGADQKKRVDSLTLGSSGDLRDSLLSGGVNTFELNLVSGRLSFAGGPPPGNASAAAFFKLGYGFTRLQDLLTGRLLAYAALRGQHAAQNLDTTEQTRIGGPEGVRAFAPGEGTGDEGDILSLELRLLPPERWLGRSAREMVASVFYDVGS